MEKTVVPESYHPTIYKINFSKLYDNGIRYAIFDIDGTLLPFDEIKVTEKNRVLFEYIKGLGIKVGLCSSGFKDRVEPVADELEVKCMYCANKPYVSFSEIEKIIGESFLPQNSVFIGDSLYFDMLLASKLRMNKIMVNMIDEGFNFKIYPNEIIQAIMFKRLEKYGLKSKKYYTGIIER